MSISSFASGTSTPTVGTPLTLANTTTAGIYILEVDCKNLANTEVVTTTVNSAAKSGGTVNSATTATYTGTGSTPTSHLYTIPIPVGSSGNFVLLQSSGTARAFDWSVWLMT